MRREAFTLLHEAENSWWYRGRARVVRSFLERTKVTAPIPAILDFGAGNGGMCRELSRLGTEVYAYEPDALARDIALQQGYTEVYTNVEEAFTRHYGLIGLFDVLEHIEDAKTVLASFRKELTPEGVLIITVPAFPFLWSEHDVLHQHFRRYTRKTLTKVLREAGYDVVAMSYWNMTLFLPTALVRLTGKSGSSTLTLPWILDTILFGVVVIESFLLRFLSLPFGVSLVVVARKNREEIK